MSFNQTYYAVIVLADQCGGGACCRLRRDGVPVASMPTTLFDRIWQRHVVHARDDGRSLLYVDCHLLQDGSAPAFAMLRQRGLAPRRPELAFGTPDHYVPTNSRVLRDVRDPEAARMATALRDDTSGAGIRIFGLEDTRQRSSTSSVPSRVCRSPAC